MLAAFISGALFGLLNLAHCTAMCGPLVSTACASSDRGGFAQYQLGRTLSYAFAGAMCGHIGSGLQLYVDQRWASWAFSALAAGACLIAAFNVARPRMRGRLYALRRSAESRRPWLQTLLLLVPRAPLPLGMLSALLPCGLLAAALLAAVATGSASGGSAFMLAFATISGMALWSASALAQVAPRFPRLPRQVLAIALVAAALVMIGRPLAVPRAAASAQPGSSPHACH